MNEDKKWWGDTRWGEPVIVGSQTWLPHISSGKVDKWVLLNDDGSITETPDMSNVESLTIEPHQTEWPKPELPPSNVYLMGPGLLQFIPCRKRLGVEEKPVVLGFCQSMEVTVKLKEDA